MGGIVNNKKSASNIQYIHSNIHVLLGVRSIDSILAIYMVLHGGSEYNSGCVMSCCLGNFAYNLLKIRSCIIGQFFRIIFEEIKNIAEARKKREKKC